MKKRRIDLGDYGWLCRYQRSDRKGKTKLLDELCDLYGYNRKYLLQVLNQLTGKQYVRRGRKRQYDPQTLLPPLKQIWLATDQLCSKRLKAAIPLWLPYYEGELAEATRQQLLTLSPASIDRLLKPHRAHYKRHGLSGTKPGYLLKNEIPIKTHHWDVTHPGFMEADTVAHCGQSLAGQFVWSLTLTDIATGWTEIRATWNKGAAGVVKQIKNIEKTLSFPLLGLDCDNGSEFLNYHVVRYLTDRRKQPIHMTRSRPYRKNDKAHVEQKNWSHVRHLFGYDRIEEAHLVDSMNRLYQNEWSLYQNHFMPNQKLVHKEKMNSKYIKKYDKAQTPYERLLTFSCIPSAVQAALKAKHQALNPFELKRRIERKLKVIFQHILRNKKPRAKF